MDFYPRLFEFERSGNIKDSLGLGSLNILIEWYDEWMSNRRYPSEWNIPGFRMTWQDSGSRPKIIIKNVKTIFKLPQKIQDLLVKFAENSEEIPYYIKHKDLDLIADHKNKAIMLLTKNDKNFYDMDPGRNTRTQSTMTFNYEYPDGSVDMFSIYKSGYVRRKNVGRGVQMGVEHYDYTATYMKNAEWVIKYKDKKVKRIKRKMLKNRI